MTLGIIQARMGSTRFPGKVMAKICGIPLLSLIVQRCQRSKLVDEWVVATTLERRDDVLCELGVPFFRGPTENVLARFYLCAMWRNLKKSDIIVRVTADDPLRDPMLIDDCVRALLTDDSLGYYTNNPPIGSEAFSMRELDYVYHGATTYFDKEHVTPWMQRRQIALTIDTLDDLERIEKLIGNRDPVTVDYRELISETVR